MPDNKRIVSRSAVIVSLTLFSYIVGYTAFLLVQDEPESVPVSHVPTQSSIEPSVGSGRVETEHPGSLGRDCSGVVVAKVVIADDNAKVTGDPDSQPFVDPPYIATVTPVYVVEGTIKLTLTVSDELRIRSNSEPTKTLTVRKGIPAETSWNVEGVRLGFGSITLKGQQLSLRDNATVIDSPDPSQIDNMEITFQVIVKEDPNCGVPQEGISATDPGLEFEFEEDNGLFGLDLPTEYLMAVGTFLALFSMWLVSRISWLQQRHPKLAAAFGWLPDQIGEFKKSWSS